MNPGGRHERRLLEIISRLVVIVDGIDDADAPDPTWEITLERAHAVLSSSGLRRCRACGCSQYDACEDGCDWAGEGLCTACVSKVTDHG